ncbi:heterokaryon incompatibility protein-domain-containing protein [Lophiotrema nucula]|uniref:Heterokaryon incompatibility protein-domain-containing protein n=1 Tax=Lophiotrema nucula TaxID=690887 RepID=A0A6A5ZHU3_9PLEO|nr:heterokaryon incompatibility protein-domain-containing protein [Lophiotrema nucula]
MSDSYQYSSLPISSDYTDRPSIRLLQILAPDTPDQDEDPPIRCQLSTHVLPRAIQEAPEYEALSYVWGSPQKNKTILVDSKALGVTENLHSALSRLRAREVGLMWIDAICINQDDLKERGHQVAHMGQIYKTAKQVIVWLGEEDEESKPLFAALYKRARLDAELMGSLLKLFRRPYFRRIWVLQEVFAAREALIMCGEDFIKNWPFYEQIQKSREDMNSDSIHWEKARRVLDLMLFSLPDDPTLGECLDMYHTQEATERSDKIFALVAMRKIVGSPPDVLIDYEVSWENLMQQVVHVILGNEAVAKTGEERDRIFINCRLSIVGRVTLSPRDSFGFAPRPTIEYLPAEGTKPLPHTGFWWHAFAKHIQVGDLLCSIPGAEHPVIIRETDTGSFVILITAPVNEETCRGPIEKLNIWRAIIQNSPRHARNRTLIWDWTAEEDSPPPESTQ